jgi:hypothetical protein
VVAAHTATYNFLTSLSQAGKFNWRDEPLFSFFFFLKVKIEKYGNLILPALIQLVYSGYKFLDSLSVHVA